MRQDEHVGFGAALEQLEEIVARLEGNPDLDLEEALALYERGAGLAKRCHAALAHAELRVTQLANEMAAGEEPRDLAE